ncbi:MAG: hypothetical protein LBG98_03980 [Puniceicoccales bacterium]|jgi:hypothetical protein|nr:hypothetical protein [Puniceicoccales bacterium]
MKLQRVIGIVVVLCCLMGGPGELRLEARGKRFTPEEDKALIAAVQKYRPMNWERVAEWLPGRTTRQCRDRWTKFLDPNINHGPFSPEEDANLRQLIEEHGSKWTLLSRFFPGRSDVQLKNRYLKLNRKRKTYVLPTSGDFKPVQPNKDEFWEPFGDKFLGLLWNDDPKESEFSRSL